MIYSAHPECAKNEEGDRERNNNVQRRKYEGDKWPYMGPSIDLHLG